jgi:hypothetical protein
MEKLGVLNARDVSVWSAHGKYGLHIAKRHPSYSICRLLFKMNQSGPFLAKGIALPQHQVEGMQRHEMWWVELL